MQFLQSIIAEIDSFIDKQFETNRKQFYGLARLQSNGSDPKEAFVPFYIQNGKGVQIDFNDKYDLSTYHRITGIGVYDYNSSTALGAKNAETTFGDAPWKQIVLSCKCVMFTKMTIFKTLTPEDVALFLGASLPYNLTRTLLKELNVKNGIILTKEVEPDPKKVWMSENSSDYKLSPYNYLFSMSYEIHLIAPRKCLVLCDNC